MSLQIRPGLNRAWRAPGRFQIGLDPRHGVVLDGLTGEHERVLAMLDGTSGIAGLLRRARRLGIPAERVHELVSALRAAGVLVPSRTHRAGLARLTDTARLQLRPDAETLSLTYPRGDGWDVVVQRSSKSVAVLGLGRAGLAIACHLARAGVGTVVLDDDTRVRWCDLAPGGYQPDDLGRRRAPVAREVLAAGCPQTRTQVSGDLRPDLLVLVAHGAVDARRTDGLLREDVVHLVVVVRERDVVVGPLVRPGRTACLRCLDLHRRDRDPEWPRLVPQLAASADGLAGREETTLAALAASLATAQALTHLDGRLVPAAADATLEASLPDGLVAVRPWTSHPECGCTWPPPRAESGAPRGGQGRMRAGQTENDTMERVSEEMA
jgi:ThiF family